MMKSVHVTIPPDEFDYTNELAKTGDRSFSAQISRMIRRDREHRQQAENFGKYGIKAPNPEKVWETFQRSETGTEVREE